MTTITTFRGRDWIGFLIAGLAWFAVLRILSTDWRIDPQYGYGMLVPFLVIGLLLKRLDDCPPPGDPSRSARALGSALLMATSLFLAMLIPMCEANPDWRPLGWVASLAVIILTLALFQLRGGLPWVLHFGFPILFFLIAVPWPRNFELAVMTRLMLGNTSVTLEILHWLGFEAAGRGNLILLPCGVLGIEEACSGIRSLQSGLMVALFAGEVFRLSVPRRFALLILALLAALLGNILRNTLLAVVASTRGLAAVSSWHDPAGYLILILTVGAVVVSAWLWGRGSVTPRPVTHTQGSPSFTPQAFPWIACIVSALLLTGSLTGSELWFRAHESADPSAGIRWDLHPRSGSPGVLPVTLAPRTMAMLFHPEGFSEKWTFPSGIAGQVFYFRWPPGRSSVQAMRMHSPEICLESIGMKLQAHLGSVTVAGIPFDSLLFSQGARLVRVFHARIREDVASGTSAEGFLDTPAERISNLLQGRRNRGERMIEIAFWNAPDENAARLALGQYLGEALTLRQSSESPR